jgi:putative transposase
VCPGSPGRQGAGSTPDAAARHQGSGSPQFVVTTESKHNLPIAPDLLQRDFTADEPNTKWTSDITYSATDEGWLYLAAFIDLRSRMIVGWSMPPHMRASLVTDALRMTWFRRRPPPGLIVHTDRRSQYCSDEFQKALTGYGMRSSMSRKGDCWDNAPTESLWGRLKVGRLHGRKFATRRQAMDEVIDWLAFYNHRRLHSTLGYVSPRQYEELELPRFRGHFFTREGVRDANPQAAVSGGLSSTDGRAGTRGSRHQ